MTLFVLGGTVSDKHKHGLNKTWRWADGWYPGPPLPCPRSYHAAVVLNGDIIVIGGVSNEHGLASVIRLRRGQSEWEDLAPLPKALWVFGAVVYNNTVYLCGGFDGTESNNQLLRLDKADWQVESEMPSALATPACTVLDGNLWVVGGFTGKRGFLTREVSSHAYTYNFAAKKWEQKASLPKRSEAHRVVTLNGTIYCIGGWYAPWGTTPVGCKALNLCLKYDFALNKWVSVSMLQEARCNHGCVAMNNKILVFAGAQTSTITLRSVEWFDPQAQVASCTIDEDMALPCDLRRFAYVVTDSCPQWNYIEGSKKIRPRHRKVLVVGEAAAGKTTFLHSLCCKKSEEHILSTVGVDHWVVQVSRDTCTALSNAPTKSGFVLADGDTIKPEEGPAASANSPPPAPKPGFFSFRRRDSMSKQVAEPELEPQQAEPADYVQLPQGIEEAKSDTSSEDDTYYLHINDFAGQEVYLAQQWYFIAKDNDIVIVVVSLESLSDPTVLARRKLEALSWLEVVGADQIVFLVGTHADLVDQACKDNLVTMADEIKTETNIVTLECVCVNAKNPDDDGVRSLSSKLFNHIDAQTDLPLLPANWVALHQQLFEKSNHTGGYIPFDQVKSIAVSLKVTELREALVTLDTLGLLKYVLCGDTEFVFAREQALASLLKNLVLFDADNYSADCAKRQKEALKAYGGLSNPSGPQRQSGPGVLNLGDKGTDTPWLKSLLHQLLPAIDLQDVMDLLQQLGFLLPTDDSDRYIVTSMRSAPSGWAQRAATFRSYAKMSLQSSPAQNKHRFLLKMLFPRLITETISHIDSSAHKHLSIDDVCGSGAFLCLHNVKYFLEATVDSENRPLICVYSLSSAKTTCRQMQLILELLRKLSEVKVEVTLKRRDFSILVNLEDISNITIKEEMTAGSDPQSMVDKDPATAAQKPEEQFGALSVCMTPTNLLGKGAFGAVYSAMYRGEPVAAKALFGILQPELYSYTPARLIAELQREVDMLSTLKHDRILPCMGCACNDLGEPMWILSPLMNCSLLDFLLHGANFIEGAAVDANPGVQSENNCICFSLDILEGLEYIHTGLSRPVVHRDIKPSNILLDDLGRCYLADFGSARFREPTMTASIGSPKYRAPEVSTGMYDTKADMHSFGMILMDLCIGKLHDFITDADRESCSQCTKHQDRLHRLAFDCVKRTPAERTSSTEALLELKSIAGLQHT